MGCPDDLKFDVVWMTALTEVVSGAQSVRAFHNNRIARQAQEAGIYTSSCCAIGLRRCTVAPC
jgi:hypothetical protein